ncbi:MAG: class I SAM-dependent methyltransferase [Chloroflexota bacterium]
MTAQPTNPGRSFDAFADEYDRYRPTYPDALFALIRRELGLRGQPTVVDLGAGTGRASLAMVALGWRVTAVEPGSAMLDVLRANAAKTGLEVASMQASAEATGLDPASADLVTAAQAFHWFDKPAAVAEMARITRPGGGVALFWNVRDETRSSFVAAYHATLDRHGGPAEGRYLQAGRASGRGPTREALESSPSFDAPALHELFHEVEMRAADFLPMAFTASYVRAMAPAALVSFRAETEALVAEHARADGGLTIPYRIDCWIARRSTS